MHPHNPAIRFLPTPAWYEAEAIYYRADAEKEYMGLTTFVGEQHILKEAVVEKNYLNEKELKSMGQLVSGYLHFAERQAEREQVMTMEDWARHLDDILTMSGEQLLQGNGSVSHNQAVEKTTEEYKKYQAKTLSSVERDSLHGGDAMLAENSNIKEEMNENGAKLELYRLLGEGYKAMQEKREITLEDLENRMK